MTIVAIRTRPVPPVPVRLANNCFSIRRGTFALALAVPRDTITIQPRPEFHHAPAVPLSFAPAVGLPPTTPRCFTDQGAQPRFTDQRIQHRDPPARLSTAQRARATSRGPRKRLRAYGCVYTSAPGNVPARLSTAQRARATSRGPRKRLRAYVLARRRAPRNVLARIPIAREVGVGA